MFPSPTQSPFSATPPFAARFGAPLPRGLREESEMMSPDAFEATYAPAVGPLRLGNWECTDASTRSGPQARNYQATIAIGDRISTSKATASGPLAALTAMLYDRGVAVEMLKFHQLRGDDGIATFIRGTDGAHDEWAMGWAPDATQSALRAVIACANRLSAA
ncbi:homocitrate synthase [Mycobacterium sp.]|uniref:homocitrate synthase n=1 Tax=Mycobacterium sp. TaxID=1785 RepID=UPI0028BE18B0|nr:homocitrate synthase [Mycobacterium sp.]